MTGTEQSYGRYKLVRKIAKGGMAEIFEARMEGPGGFDKRVALKRLHANLAADDLFVKMLADEARITARMRHPNICQIFDFGVEGDTWFLAMELIEGCDLGNLVRRAKKLGVALPVEGAVWIAREAAEGLAYAHALCDDAGRPVELVHRDVSPQNVLVSTHGEVKVCDFGIAKATARMAKTEAGVLKGKFCYMAPEHARGDPLDGRADVFSLAIVLFELVSGVPLYPQVFNRDVLEQVRQGAYPPLAKLCPMLPAGLQRILGQALLPSRAARIDARRFADSLAELARREGHSFDRARLGRIVTGVLPELGKREVDDGVATQMWSGSDRLGSGDLEPISELDPSLVSSDTIAATPSNLRALPERGHRSGPPTVPSDARVRTASRPPGAGAGDRASGRGFTPREPGAPSERSSSGVDRATRCGGGTSADHEGGAANGGRGGREPLALDAARARYGGRREREWAGRPPDTLVEPDGSSSKERAHDDGGGGASPPTEKGAGRGWLIAAGVIVAGSIAGVGFALHLPPPTRAPELPAPVPLSGQYGSPDAAASPGPPVDAPSDGGGGSRASRKGRPRTVRTSSSGPGGGLPADAAVQRDPDGVAAPAATGGSILITAVPTGTAWVDGRRAGRTPVTVRVSAGRHNVVVESGDGRTARRYVVIGAGATERVHLDLE